mgnify:CR=1 FL=1
MDRHSSKAPDKYQKLGNFSHKIVRPASVLQQQQHITTFAVSDWHLRAYSTQGMRRWRQLVIAVQTIKNRELLSRAPPAQYYHDADGVLYGVGAGSPAKFYTWALR